MASASGTSSYAATGTRNSGNKRSATSNLESSAKRPKVESKLDKLKGRLKDQVATMLVDLETGIIKENIKREDLIRENAKTRYESLLKFCQDHLKDGRLMEKDLIILGTPFAGLFLGEDTLRSNLGGSFDDHDIAVDRLDGSRSKVVELAKQVLLEAGGLPPPNKYAHSNIWRAWQERDTAILNMRPLTKRGPPIQTLHPIFAKLFTLINSMNSNDWSPDPAVNEAAVRLCDEMAGSFIHENGRREKLIEVFKTIGVHLATKFEIPANPPLEMHGAKVDLVSVSINILPEAIGEMKGEYEGGDPYMQVSRSYQVHIHNIKTKSVQSVSDGVPTMLLAICGPNLILAAGFYDGRDVIVEPIADVLMLPAITNSRAKRLAQILFVIRQTITELQKYRETHPTLSVAFPPGTPRIYQTFTSLAGTTFHLEFIKHIQIGPYSNYLYTAKSPSLLGRTLLVKLVESYSTHAHNILAQEHLAPELFGTASVEGAPLAIIMEYLDPADGWTTLFDYIAKHYPQDQIDVEHPQLSKLLDVMKQKGIVHGDLRPNNILCRINSGELEVRVVDYDWSGVVGTVKYPALRNCSIPWPGAANELIGLEDDRILLEKTLKALKEKLKAKQEREREKGEMD